VNTTLSPGQVLEKVRYFGFEWHAGIKFWD
jgi:hypothetical protein